MRALKSSIRNIRRTPFQALAAISVLALTFFIATVITLLVYASGQLLDHFEKRPQIIAFLRDDSPDDATGALLRKIRVSCFSFQFFKI